MIYIYLDLYFAVNLLSDVFIMIIFCMLINIRIRMNRIIIASCLGALSSILVMVFMIPPVLTQLFGLGAAYIMLNIVLYGRKVSVSEMIRYILSLYMICFLLGGIIYYITSGQIDIIILWLIMLSTTVVVYFCHGRNRPFGAGVESSCRAEVMIRAGTREYRGIGYYDSGNCAYEPISGALVIIGDIICLESFLTDGEKEYIRLFPKLPDQWDGETMIRGIPYSSVGNGRGIIPGIRLDAVTVSYGSRVYEYDNCYIGISKDRLSLGGGCDIILHRKMHDH